MVFKNVKYAFSIVGLLKIATVVLGIISVALIGHAYEKSFYNNYNRLESSEFVQRESISKETFYLSVAVMWCVLSLGYLLRYILTDQLENSYGDKFFDMGYHILGGVLIFVGSCVVFSSATSINNLVQYWDGRNSDIRFQYKGEKIIAAIFGLINSVIYLFTAAALFFLRNKPYPVGA